MSGLKETGVRIIEETSNSVKKRKKCSVNNNKTITLQFSYPEQHKNNFSRYKCPPKTIINQKKIPRSGDH